MGPVGDQSGQKGVAMPEDANQDLLLRTSRKSTGVDGEMQVILNCVHGWAAGSSALRWTSKQRVMQLPSFRSHSEMQTR